MGPGAAISLSSLFNRLWSSSLPVYKSFLGHKIKFHYFDLWPLDFLQHSSLIVFLGLLY